jgi:hypothetical protein
MFMNQTTQSGSGRHHVRPSDSWRSWTSQPPRKQTGRQRPRLLGCSEPRPLPTSQLSAPSLIGRRVYCPALPAGADRLGVVLKRSSNHGSIYDILSNVKARSSGGMAGEWPAGPERMLRSSTR